MSTIKRITFAGTGHRPNKLENAYELSHPKAQRIMAELRAKLLSRVMDSETNEIMYDEVVCISGMALGWDTYLAQVVLDLKTAYPQFKLVAAIPCKGHGENWPSSSKKLYKDIISKADEYVLVTDEYFKPYLMQVRNEYMVNRADEMLSLWDGTSGGTKNCIDYALKTNKPILNLHPNTYEWSDVMKDKDPKSQLSLF